MSIGVVKNYERTAQHKLHWTVVCLCNLLTFLILTMPSNQSHVGRSFLKFLPRAGLEVPSSAAATGTKPPNGALIVRQTNTLPGEYSTIPQAVNALKSLKGPQTIFVYPGTYRLKVSLQYKYPLTLQGYTSDPSSYAGNQVTVSVASSRAESGGDAQSSAIWVRQDDFKMLNINAVNSYGTGTDTQAVALTSQGSRHVYSMCSFSSYQDTLYVQASRAYFFKCNIEGAVDFIFGAGNAWFESANILVKAPKYLATITAQERPGTSSAAKFVFNRSNVVGGPGTPPGSAYLGRPWSEFAAVTFQFCALSNVVNQAGWIGWNPPSDLRTKSVQFFEFQNYGPGSQPGHRSIGKTAQQAIQIGQVLGSDYASWAT